jgi:sugar lactone lactonase YvrE
MKLNSTTFRIQAIISLVLIFISTNLLFSQSQEWNVYNTKGKFITCLAEEGEYLWVGTYGGGLVKLNKSTGEIIVYGKWNSKLPDNYVSAIAIDAQGNKWIGTRGGGLAKFDGVNWTVYNTSNSGLPDYAVTAIAIDAQGNKWIGTERGLAVFREGGVKLK